MMGCNKCIDIHRGQLFGNSNKICICNCHNDTKPDKHCDYLGNTRVDTVSGKPLSTPLKPSRITKINPPIEPDINHYIIKRFQWIEGELSRLREQMKKGDEFEDG